MSWEAKNKGDIRGKIIEFFQLEDLCSNIRGDCPLGLHMVKPYIRDDVPGKMHVEGGKLITQGSQLRPGCVVEVCCSPL